MDNNQSDSENNNSANIEGTSKREMATTPIQNLLLPDKYCGDTDVEEFIQECERFFEISQTVDPIKPLVIAGLIDRSVSAQYNATEDSLPWKERLRKAYSVETNLLEDWRTALNVEKSNDSPAVYFQKVDKLVTKLLSHSYSKESLTAYILTNGLTEEDRREIFLRDAKTSAQIKTVIEKMHTISKSATTSMAPISSRRSYANVMATPQPTWAANQTNRAQDRRPKGCFECGEFGHRAAQCRRKFGSSQTYEGRARSITCYACQESGHVRRDCPNVRCSLCHKNGHLRRQCREDAMRNNYPRRQWQERNQRPPQPNANNGDKQGRARSNPRGGSMAAMGDGAEEDGDVGSLAGNEHAPMAGGDIGALQ